MAAFHLITEYFEHIKMRSLLPHSPAYQGTATLQADFLRTANAFTITTV